jgi:DNA repair exonuclease SbcCD nuclease subunit
MVRFLHTADWQIGKPYANVGDEQKRSRLLQERFAVVQRIAAVAERQAVCFVLVAGDLFDSTTVPIAAVMEVLEAIGAMTVPVLVIPGNHDHGGAGSLWHHEEFRRQQARFAPNLQVLLERVPLELEQAVLLPCPLLRRADNSDPAAWIAALDPASLPAAKPRLVLAHGGTQGFSGRDYDLDDEAPPGANNCIELAQLGEAGVDYVALGDWHGRKEITPWAWYPGTPEPDRFGQGDSTARGQVLVVEVERGKAPRVESVATGRLRWHRLSFHFGDDGDLDRFERLLHDQLEGRVARDLLRLEVSGSLSLAGHERYDRLIEELRHQLLHLRLKGQCDPVPQAAELEALTQRPGDPLIAGVAAQLQRRLDDATASDPTEAALCRAALCQLYQLVSGR